MYPPTKIRTCCISNAPVMTFIYSNAFQHEKNTMEDKKEQIFSCKCGVIHRALCFWLASNKHCSRPVLFKQSLNGVQPRTLRLLSLARNQKVVSRQQKPCVELCCSNQRTHQLVDQKILQLWFQTTYIICAHNKCQTPSIGSLFSSRLVPATLCFTVMIHLAF